MSRLGILPMAFLPMFVLATDSAAMTKPETCIQVSSGIRGGYSSNKTYKCQVDLSRLWLVDQDGNKRLAPAGLYKVGTDEKPGIDTKRVGVGGFILK